MLEWNFKIETLRHLKDNPKQIKMNLLLRLDSMAAHIGLWKEISGLKQHGKSPTYSPLTSS